MKYEIYTPENRITEDKYRIIYRILVDNYFNRNPDYLNSRNSIDTKEKYESWVNTILTTPDYYINIYYEEDIIIGFIAYMYKDRELCLSEVQIKEDYIGHGKLKCMLDILYRNSKRENYDIIYGTISPSNERSKSVFTHIGLVNTYKNRYEINKDEFEEWLYNN